MSVLSKMKCHSDQEYLLYETLKLKKHLESRYLKGVCKIKLNELKLICKGLVITNSLSFILNKDIIELITIIEDRLCSDFLNYQIKGEKFTIQNLLNTNNTPSFFEQLIEFNNDLETYNSTLIVQGSYADSTHISYSDLDLVIIGYLSEEVQNLKTNIEQLLLSIDPLQHHGVFFINKNSLENYWQMDLPIQTLKKSLVLSRMSTLTINIPYYFNEKLSSYNWVMNFINHYPTLPITMSSGAFFAKYFLSQLLLVPVLFLASMGHYIYKRESFSYAEKYYSNEAWLCIEIASSIRTNWNQAHISSKYESTRINTSIINVTEYNTLSFVVNLTSNKMSEFCDKYLLFVNETKKLLIMDQHEV
ncbi:MAG: nucleotidyltransferase domain-containing protein [Methylococcaceae bacterium]